MLDTNWLAAGATENPLLPGAGAGGFAAAGCVAPNAAEPVALKANGPDTGAAAVLAPLAAELKVEACPNANAGALEGDTPVAALAPLNPHAAGANAAEGADRRWLNAGAAAAVAADVALGALPPKVKGMLPPAVKAPSTVAPNVMGASGAPLTAVIAAVLLAGMAAPNAKLKGAA